MEIFEYYLKNFKNDEREVSLQRIPCDFIESDIIGEESLVEEYLKSILHGAVDNGKHTSLKDEFKHLSSNREYEILEMQ